jgi:glycosyltransferase involved in cell wall biosynthesis
MKVGICIPSRGQMEIGTAFDLAVMCAYDARHRDGTLAIYTVNGTLIFDQRNNLVKTALDEGCDYILFIDADMRFPKDTIERLMGLDLPIVGVNATTRSEPVRATAKNLKINYEDKTNEWLPVDSKDKTGIEQVTAIGCGVMLVKAEVFKKTPEPWFWFYELPGKKIMGEDVHFCVQAYDAGFNTFCDHALSNMIGHVGSYTYGWHDVPNQLQRPKDDGSKLPRKKRPNKRNS